MTITRTPDLAVPDGEFDVHIPITKSYVDSATGKRYITGVATGVAEDRDGERCSVNCVKSMGQQIGRGGVKITSSHQQDWMTEIGDVHKAAYDPESDELSIEAELPAEGVDPIADKAWRTANTEKVGWSIGGKLLKSYFERNEVGKKRKVLDSILLKHVALTKNPSYATSFATAVAKTYAGDEPADDEFTLDADDDVAKNLTTGSWVSGDSDSGGGNVGRDSVGSGKRNAGSNKGGAKMRTEDPKDTSEDDSDEDADDGKDLPEGKDQQRHLSCPNCGHEFAADLPVDSSERQLDDLPNDRKNDEDESDTGKSHTEKPMATILKETLDVLKALAEREDVQKTATDAEPAADAVGDDAALSDVEKIVAASHRAHEDRLDRIEKSTGEGFELIAKSLKGLQDALADMPQGRRSVARTLPPTVGHDGEPVAKTLEQEVEEAPDTLSALKAVNRHAGWTTE